MSAKLHVVADTPSRFRSVEMARRHETDTWALADAVWEDVTSLLPAQAEAKGSAADGVNTGLSAAEDEVYREHRDAGTEVGRNYLHNLYVTRRVWPPGERRPDLAGFNVHFELRGKEYKNRRELIEKHAARSKTGRWSRADLVRWKSERKPQPMKSFRELFEERVRRATFQAAKPWHHLTAEERDMLAKIVRDIANEISDGTFGT